jgi:acyl carrier protein
LTRTFAAAAAAMPLPDVSERMRQYEEILVELYSVLQPFAKGQVESLSEETELVADLEIDSLKLMELMLEIEDRFDVSVPLNILPDVSTVQDLAVKLEELINKNP